MSKNIHYKTENPLSENDIAIPVLQCEFKIAKLKPKKQVFFNRHAAEYAANLLECP